MWTIDPENISPEKQKKVEKYSPRIQEEFERIVKESRVYLESERAAQDEIDSELNRPIDDGYWRNINN